MSLRQEDYKAIGIHSLPAASALPAVVPSWPVGYLIVHILLQIIYSRFLSISRFSPVQQSRDTLTRKRKLKRKYLSLVLFSWAWDTIRMVCSEVFSKAKTAVEAILSLSGYEMI